MLMFDRRLVAHFDWLLFAAVLLVVATGITTVLSATYMEGQWLSPVAVRQVLWAVAGLAALAGMVTFDYRHLERYAYAIYACALALLCAVPWVGATAGGSRRWLSLGPVSLQPSEPMKIALLIALARFLHLQAGKGPLPLRSAAACALLGAAPAYLILTQPDLGTVLLLGLAVLTVLLLGGLRLRYVLLAVLVLGPLLPLAWTHLKPYQQRRILTFVDPQADPLGAGYHIIQSKIAIGSGGLTGKGYLHGTQNHLNFLPEQHTDFIFSVFAEEWGFVGAVLLLGLYALVIGRCAFAAMRAKDTFGLLLAAGVTALLFWQVAVNIAMASGLLPVVGLTLPLFSYGGSSLITSLAAIGIVLNVGMRRFTF